MSEDKKVLTDEEMDNVNGGITTQINKSRFISVNTVLDTVCSAHLDGEDIATVIIDN